MSEYWDEDKPVSGGAGGGKDDDEDDEVEIAQKSAGVSAGNALDLDAHIPAKGRLLLGAEEEAANENLESMVLGFEVVNSQVDRQKLSDSSLMKFVTKIASSAPSKGHEKRQIVVLASAEFTTRVAPNLSSLEFVEVGRTDVAVDDASPTFSLPVRVTCRKGTERMVKVQLQWSQSGMLKGGDTVLGSVTERFSDLMAKTANLQPLVFPMSMSAACPHGRAMVWRVPMPSLHPPNSPYVSLASKRHVSFSIPYVFRKAREGNEGSRASNRRTSKPGLVDDGGAALAERVGPELVLAKENTIEGRFAYRMPSLYFRPFVKRMEAALAAWQQRYEVERVQQGYFSSDAEAFAHGRVLVRLSVVEAAGLPLFRSEDVGKDDYFAGLTNARSLTIPSVSTGSALAQKLVRNKSPEDKQLKSNPFVAVVLEKPQPQLGMLVGHTNTEYSTQNPIFGQNTNSKLCPHTRPRESFSVCGATRLGRAPAIEPPCFMFYAHSRHVGHTNIRLEVCQEAYTLQGGMSVQLASTASLPLDAAYLATQDLDETRDKEVWLPLLDKDGNDSGRILVRLSIFEGDGAGLDPVQVAAKAAAVSPETYRPCYEWMRHTGLSGRMPREWDIFSEAPETVASAERLQLRYPPEWIKAHIVHLQQQLTWLQSSLRLWETAASEGRGFRSSDLKVTPELQGVPINLHAQTFVVSDCGSLSSSGPSSPAPASSDLLSFPSAQPPADTGRRPLFIYDLVSTGAPTAHSLGFRRGGLLSLQSEMAAAQKDMDAIDEQLRAPGVQGPCLPTGPCGELANRLLSDLLKFEAIAAKVAVRRALVTSQALTIAVTSLVSKLDIMLTPDADKTVVERCATNMAKAGFLVCFQGLVSTIGKEQGMQEDVAVAMELASLYSFELRGRKSSSSSLNSPGPRPQASPIAPAPPASDDLLDFMSSATPPPPPPPGPVAVGAKTETSLGLDIEFDHAAKRVRLHIDQAALERLPKTLQPRSASDPVVIPIIAILFAQGIDAKQTIANLSNQLKPGASTNVGGNSTLQPVINRRSLRVLNDYVHRCYPTPNPGPKAAFDRMANRLETVRATAYGSSEDFARSIDEISIHPMLEPLKEAVKRDNGSFKNVDLLRDQERVVLEVGGGQVIFCKSGKDRTGMAITLHQARLLADRHGTGNSMDKVVHDANVMRLYGTRLIICEKNVGRLKYAFNALQLQFMPSEYRPPTETIEDMVNSFLCRDTT